MTSRRLAAWRFAVVSAILALIAVWMDLDACPVPHGWVLPAFFCFLAEPISLSIADVIRCPAMQRDDLHGI